MILNRIKGFFNRDCVDVFYVTNLFLMYFCSFHQYSVNMLKKLFSLNCLLFI